MDSSASSREGQKKALRFEMAISPSVRGAERCAGVLERR